MYRKFVLLLVVLWSMVLFEKAAGAEEIEGKLVCIHCELKQHKISSKECKECKIYGRNYGLKLKDGTIWSFIENDRSKSLVAGKFTGKEVAKVTVYGNKFPKAHYIDVDNFKVCKKDKKGRIKCKEYVWCIVNKKMKHNHGGGKVSYEGKTYDVCCSKCKKKFKSNPRKYVIEGAKETHKHKH